MYADGDPNDAAQCNHQEQAWLVGYEERSITSKWRKEVTRVKALRCVRPRRIRTGRFDSSEGKIQTASIDGWYEGTWHFFPLLWFEARYTASLPPSSFQTVTHINKHRRRKTIVKGLGMMKGHKGTKCNRKGREATRNNRLLFGGLIINLTTRNFGCLRSAWKLCNFEQEKDARAFCLSYSWFKLEQDLHAFRSTRQASPRGLHYYLRNKRI